MRKFFQRMWSKLTGRKYAAAKTGTQTGAWRPIDAGVNEEIGTSKELLNARTRQLVRDMPHFARAVNVMVDFTVGDGIRLQSRVANTDGSLNVELSKKIEEAWRRWGDECDVTGQLSIHEMAQLAKRQDVEIGEFVILKAKTRKTGKRNPFALRIYEADRIGDYNATPKGNNEISYGVEYNTTTGAPAAYHFVNDDWRPATRVNASQVYHGFQSLRPGQYRGVSPFAPAILIAHSLRDFVESELGAAQLAAKHLAFITSPDPANAQTAFGAATNSNFDRKTEDLGVATIEYLAENERVDFATYSRPGSGFDPFTKFALRTLAITVGIPYEVLTGDMSGVNFSTMKGAMNAFDKSLRPVQARHIRQFYQAIYNDWMDWAVLSGDLVLPGYFADPARFQAATWVAPGLAQIDPLKEGKADVEAIQNLLRSPQDVIQGQGRDPEKVLEQIKAWEEAVEEAGLKPEPISLSDTTNPAALMDDGEEEDD
jgi:lambda family phage portal protein